MVDSLMPREKLKKYGPDKLTDKELLSLILRTGPRGKSVVDLSIEVYNQLASIGIDNINLNALLQIKGIGLSKACEVIASFELSKRLLKGKKTRVYLSPKDVQNAMQDVIQSRKEHFAVFYLDSRNQEIIRDIVSIGTLNGSLVHPREVFENAIKYNAASILIAHNHPSGDPSPSDPDLEVTQRLKEAGEILGIELLDHVIVTKSDIFSFKNENLLNSV